MRIELVCTGDELVTGQVTDTNSPWVEARLLEVLGEKVARVVLVGDVREHITSALLAASERADVVLVSGGLGPTVDDFTVECAAAAAGVSLDEDVRVLANLSERFARRGIALTPNNARQARVPRGAEVVLNPVGSSPLFILRLNDADLYFLPGVPRELRALVEGEVLPRLAARAAASEGRVYRAVRVLKTVGLPESHLDARVAPLRSAHPRVVFGFRTLAPENHLKLMAEADSEREAAEALAAAEAAARPLLVPFLFGADGDELGGRVLTLLAAHNATAAVVEVGTGGAVAQVLTAPECAGGEGAEALATVLQLQRERVVGAVAAASARVLEEWVGVPAALLGGVSGPSAAADGETVARALAEGVRIRTRADFGLAAVQGGPRAGAHEPAVAMTLAVAGPDEMRVETHAFSGDFARVRHLAAGTAVDLLRRVLEGV